LIHSLGQISPSPYIRAIIGAQDPIASAVRLVPRGKQFAVIFSKLPRNFSYSYFRSSLLHVAVVSLGTVQTAQSDNRYHSWKHRCTKPQGATPERYDADFKARSLFDLQITADCEMDLQSRGNIWSIIKVKLHLQAPVRTAISRLILATWSRLCI